MPLLLTLIQITIGMAVVAGIALFVLPAFLVVVGAGILFLIAMGVYHTYWTPQRNNGEDNSFFYHRANSSEEQRKSSGTIIEGEYKVVDDNKK